MNATIENLWNGNIRPYKKCGAGDPEVEELREFMKRHAENLEQGLDEKQKDIFGKYLTCAEECLYLIAVHAFGEGFALAAKLMAAALPDEE